jgi:hypothetical protein
LYVPGSHDEHSVDPRVDTVPAAHGSHVALPSARVAAEKVSAGHFVQKGLPAGSCANVPAGQSPHTRELLRTGGPAVDVPSGHAEQLLRWLAPSAAENVPLRQATHCAMPAAPGISE